MPLEAFKALYLVSITLGGFIIVSLLAPARRQFPGSKILAALLAAVLVFPLHSYVQAATFAVPWPITLSTHCFILLYGPFIYFMLKLVSKRPMATRSMVVHFIPFVITLSLVLSDVDYPQKLLVILAALQIVGYLLFNLVTAFKHRALLTTVVLHYRNSGFYWLLHIMLAATCYALLDIVLLMIQLWYQPLINDQWRAAVALISLYLVAIAGFYAYRPMWFPEPKDVDAQLPVSVSAGDSSFGSTTSTQQPMADSNAAGNTKSAEAIEFKNNTEHELTDHRELSDTLASALKQQLITLVEQQRPHLKNDLSLTELATQLEITASQLSELLNQHMGVSFYNWLNQLRYDEAQRLLLDQDCQQSIIDIAYLAGFNNKNTFYRVFKQQSGLTPNQFRQQQRNSLSPCSLQPE